MVILDGCLIFKILCLRYIPWSEYPDPVFPDYCNGAIYMLSDEAVVQILNSTPMVNKIRLEDVLFTGIIGQLSNLTRFNTPAFSYDIVS